MAEIIKAEYGEDLYYRSLELRHEVLRAPLGMKYTPEELAADNGITYFLYVDNGEILGVVGVQDKGSGKMQLKQMGISDKLKGQGIGRLLVLHLESYCREIKAKEIILEARLYAKGFYEKLGYTEYGVIYEKIGLPHVMMSKSI